MEVIKLSAKSQEKALQYLQGEIEKNPEAASAGLRISVIGGGCSGLKYSLSFEGGKEGDIVQEYPGGLKVMVDEKSALYLMGSSLDYYDGLNKSGFEITNPQASSTCGCGESFGV